MIQPPPIDLESLMPPGSTVQIYRRGDGSWSASISTNNTRERRPEKAVKAEGATFEELLQNLIQ